MDAKIKKKLQTLVAHYTKQLPDKISAIELIWRDLLLHWDTELFQTFHRDVHSLCGSSGTYGYLELSKVARQLEIYLKSLLGSGPLNFEQKELINVHLTKIKQVLSAQLKEKLPTFDEVVETPKVREEKLIYILEQDKDLSKELTDTLGHMGYHAFSLEDSYTLKMALEQRPPIAMLIDTFYLSQPGIEEVLQIQRRHVLPIQLFCIVPNAGLQSRLEAIRAGCNSFFQKPVDVFDLAQTLNQKCSLTGESYRILIIDDSESLGEYYSLILTQAGMITHFISNPMTLLEAIEFFYPDLLLMDLYMPGCTGLELAAVLRQEPRYMKIPIIFLSTEDDTRKKLSAISIGGDDFLTKPVSSQHLISAVRSRSRRAGVLKHYMTTDSLTGLLNHSSILRQLDVEVGAARQKNMPLSFVMIDIDNFKAINDTYGHPVGDIVIKKLSISLLARLRNEDIIGRYGGEEFAVILQGADGAKSKKIIDELRNQFSQFCFSVNDAHFFVSFSAGISYLKPLSSAQSLIDEADIALYEAKQKGRNQSIIFQAKDKGRRNSKAENRPEPCDSAPDRSSARADPQ